MWTIKLNQVHFGRPDRPDTGELYTAPPNTSVEQNSEHRNITGCTVVNRQEREDQQHGSIRAH